MLFNSHIFIFVFLPITLIGFFALRGLKSSLPVRLWLLATSLLFYAWWNPPYTLLLILSIGMNFLVGRVIRSLRDTNPAGANQAMIVGVVLNLLPLFYYKYSTFFLENVSELTGLDFAIRFVFLPLAISFYTFTQIAYLVDVKREKAADYGILDYSLFVTFFPHLIAGPIVHHSDLVPQFGTITRERDISTDVATGVAFFVTGLVKKIIVADNISVLAPPVFNAAAMSPPGLFDAWTAVFAFSLGLYFDFSAYSDMAVGLARMFGIRLPYNFASPYQATSIIDFWRRWHITLSQFLRDYLYIPLGGNRRGGRRRYVNLMLTMLIGGLWHGANWTFLIWGGLHGIYLLINHAWNALAAPRGIVLGAFLSRTITLLAVAIAWVFFTSPNFPTALSMLGSMAGLHGLLPAGESSVIAESIFYLGPTEAIAQFGRAQVFADTMKYVLLAVAAMLALFAPNSQAIIDGHALRPDSVAYWFSRIVWTRVAAVGFSIAFVASVLMMSDVREFVYFQF